MLVVDDFKGEATQSKVFLFRVLPRIQLPLLVNDTGWVQALRLYKVELLPVYDRHAVRVVIIILFKYIVLVSIVYFIVFGLLLSIKHVAGGRAIQLLQIIAIDKWRHTVLPYDD